MDIFNPEPPKDQDTTNAASSPEASQTQAPVEESQSVEEVNKGLEPEPLYLQILREHNMLESNIPVNSVYWKIRP